MARPKVLMLTNSELGQANVFLATAHSLLEQDPDIKVHVASFPGLEKLMRRALAGQDGDANAVDFHTLPGRPMFECLNSGKDPENRLFSVSLLKPGFRHTPATIRFLTTRAFLCWTPEEFATLFDEICSLIRTLEPKVVLVDQIFAPGLTAAKHMKSYASKAFTLAIISPNSLKDYVHHLEPRAAPLWKWPIVGSGLRMPIPWSMIPLNIYLMFRLIGIMVADKNSPAIIAKVRELTKLPELDIVTNLSMVHGGLSGIDKVLIGSRPEVDFPSLDLVSPARAYLDKLVGCGPILRPITDLNDELAVWLRRGPVIYINLGTHCLTSEAEAVEMARSLKSLMDAASTRQEKMQRLQVLWKLQKDVTRSGDYELAHGSPIHRVLAKEMDEDRVRIVDWLSSEPGSILHAGDVVCSISHGGANSFYEALW
ncbi:hypothetical protein ACJ41O_013226 [Fusarium nematophilum]